MSREKMLMIRKAAVIGAGTMGAQIAAHLANLGIPSLLLDLPPTQLTPEEKARGLTLQCTEVRNRLTQTLFQRAKKLSPAPFYLPENARFVRIGNLEDNLADLKEADWIIEAALEKMDVKRALQARMAAHARPDAMVTTNTSGLSINRIVEGLPREHVRRFFGTHFFNPPRYVRLLEMIPAQATDPALLDSFRAFAENVLGKGVVIAKDTTGFVANRIGCFAMQQALWLALEEGLTVDEVDAIAGRALGRPKSGVYRLGDIVGVDLIAQIAQNFSAELQHDDQLAMFKTPDFLLEMIQRGWWGEKKGQGFYKRIKGDAGSQILALDLKTLEYRPRQKPRFPSLETAAKTADPAERIRALCATGDPAGRFAWKHLRAVLCYAADRLTEIADDIITVDRALKWGFNWELGPFETWDALGVRETVRRLEEENHNVPALVRDLLRAGRNSFYETRAGQRFLFDPAKGDQVALPAPPKEICLPLLHRDNKVVRSNAGASLVDLSDGVACLEFHSKMNVVGPDQLAMLTQALEEVRKNFVGLVIGNQGEHFSAGANLLLIATHIQNQEWDEIEWTVRRVQDACNALRQFEAPVIVACHNYTLGAGAEVAMGADYVVAAAETYLGLPEVGVGVIPAAGGTKGMLIRCTETAPRTEQTDYFPYVQQAWETIGLAKVSTSATEAVQLKYLRPSETRIVPNNAWLIGEAKAKALQWAAEGYRPPAPRNDIPALGESGLAQFKLVLHQMRVAGQITDHDQKIGTKLAHVLCGGNLTSLHFVSEQYLLDLEREAFVSLCGEPKTLERIAHMLKTGKPLRN